MWYNFSTFFTTTAILFITFNLKCTHADGANEAQIEETSDDVVYEPRPVRAPGGGQAQSFLRSLRGGDGSLHFLRSLRAPPGNSHFLRSLRSPAGSSHFIRALKSGRHFLRSLRSPAPGGNLHFLRSLRSADTFPRTMKSAHFLRSLRSAEQVLNDDDGEDTAYDYAS